MHIVVSNKHCHKLALRWLLLSACVVLGAHPILAQYAIGGSPRSTHEDQQLRIIATTLDPKPSDTIRLDPLSPTELRKLHSAEQIGLRPLTFATTRALDLSTQNSGTWRINEAGLSSWRLTIISPKAFGIGLRFESFVLPKGAALYARGADGRIRGAFTELNNSPDSLFHLAPTPGEAITLELDMPQGFNPLDKKLSMRITRLYHDFRGLRADPSETIDPDRYGTNYGEPYYDFRRTSLERIKCIPNSIARPNHATSARSVIMMVIDGTSIASGALINNTRSDGTAYVLTAAHNINGLFGYPKDLNRIKAGVASIVFFFRFESPSSDEDIRPTEEQSLSGAELVAYHPEGDMALLKITGIPIDATGKQSIPPSYNAYLSGWDLSNSPRAPYYGIHHPLGSTKRYSLVDGAIKVDDYIEILDYPWKDRHWHIAKWAEGCTAAGSSGSPLFDAHGRIIGALSGGSSTCGAPYDDYYFMISKNWSNSTTNNSLKPWLDPDNTGTTVLDGLDPHQANPIQRISHFYGQRTKERLMPSPVTPSRAGIGREVSLSAEASILGAYIVFAPDKIFKKGIAPLTLELSPINEDRSKGSPIWTTSINQTNYTYYSKAANKFDQQQRTLHLSPIEIFIPNQAPRATKVTAGRYLLSVRTTGGEEMNVPIYYRPMRTTEINHDRIWELSPAGAWSETSADIGSYWIDLVVEGLVQNGNEAYTLKQDNLYNAYYHNGQYYIRNLDITPAQLSIYSIEGYLIQVEDIQQGESIIPLRGLQHGASYIAIIKGEKGRIAQKFTH